MLLIPAIDLRGGRCVRLLQGRFDAETVYATDPIEILGRYRALGAKLIHVVDLDGARQGSQGNREAIGRLAAADAQIVFSCVGNDDDLRSVMLGTEGAFAGLDKDAQVVQGLFD